MTNGPSEYLTEFLKNLLRIVDYSGHDRIRVSWRVRPTPRIPCFFTEFGGGHFDDIRCVRRKKFLMFDERHSLCLKEDTPCVRRGHSLRSTEDILCVGRKTFLVLNEGHSLCSKKDIA